MKFKFKFDRYFFGFVCCFWFIFQCFFLFCLCDTRNKSWLEDHIWHFNKSLSTSETWFSNQRKKNDKTWHRSSFSGQWELFSYWLYLALTNKNPPEVTCGQSKIFCTFIIGDVVTFPQAPHQIPVIYSAWSNDTKSAFFPYKSIPTLYYAIDYNQQLTSSCHHSSSHTSHTLSDWHLSDHWSIVLLLHHCC